MPVGKPIYAVGDEVSFFIVDGNKKEELVGEVSIVDASGIFGDKTQVYYDIMVLEDKRHNGRSCLYKHIPEHNLSAKENTGNSE